MHTEKGIWCKIFYFVFVNVSKSDSTNSKTHTLYIPKKKKKLRFNIGYYYTGQRKRQILLNVRILYKGKKYPRNKFYYSQSLRNYVQLIYLKIEKIHHAMYITSSGLFKNSNNCSSPLTVHMKNFISNRSAKCHYQVSIISLISVSLWHHTMIFTFPQIKTKNKSYFIL